MSDVLLDLVRQYGNEQANIVGAMEMAGPDQVQEHEQAAEALLTRIAALIPQQPVQARTTSGDLIWQHIPCGWAHPWHPEATPDAGPDGDPVGCSRPGPWRPLLVGGDPAPEQPSVPGSTVGPHRYERGPYAVDGAQVCGLCGERRAAAIHRSAQPAEPGPLRLTLPEVPDGTVGLVGKTTGHRWTPTEFGRWVDEETGQVRGILPLLEREGSVTVELAPPCEPTLAEDVETVGNAIGEAYVGDDVFPAFRRIKAALTEPGATT